MTAAEYPPESRVDYAGHVWDRLPDGNWRARINGAVSPTPKFPAPPHTEMEQQMTTPATRRQYRNNSRTDLDLRAGELLANRRVTMNMSQGEVAEEWARVAGVPRSQVTVTNYETGRTPLTLSQLFQVCEVLGMSPATVLELGTTVDRDGRHPWTTPRVILPPVSDRPRVQ